MQSLIDSIYELITRETDEGPVYDLSALDDANNQIKFLSLLADLNFKAGGRPVTGTEAEALRKYAHEATKVITELAGGGSELFGRKIGEMYTADLSFCRNRIRDRETRLHDQLVKTVKKSKELAS